MDQTILSGLFALGGTIIGGGVTLIATEISNRKQVNLELKKQRIEFLNIKRIKLEGIVDYISSPIDSKGVRIKARAIFCFLQNNSHFFVDKKSNYGEFFKKLHAEINDIWCLIEFGIPELDDEFMDKQIDKVNETIAKFRSLIIEDLKEVVFILEKEMTA